METLRSERWSSAAISLVALPEDPWRAGPRGQMLSCQALSG